MAAKWIAYLWFWGDCQNARVEGVPFVRGAPDAGGLRLADDPSPGMSPYLEVEMVLDELGPEYRAFAVHRYVLGRKAIDFPRGAEMERTLKELTHEFEISRGDPLYFAALQTVRDTMLSRVRKQRRDQQARYRANHTKGLKKSA